VARACCVTNLLVDRPGTIHFSSFVKHLNYTPGEDATNGRTRRTFRFADVRFRRTRVKRTIITGEFENRPCRQCIVHPSRNNIFTFNHTNRLFGRRRRNCFVLESIKTLRGPSPFITRGVFVVRFAYFISRRTPVLVITVPHAVLYAVPETMYISIFQSARYTI